MKTPFFSIGIPVYNASRYLAECLESILSQDFQDYEIVLVDDGSTDDSYSICSQYADKDFRIKLFRKENGGISSACNMLLDNTQGLYFFQMDNDDTMHENCLEKAYQSIINNNYPDILQCGYKQYAFDNPTPVLERMYYRPDDSYFTDNYDSNTVALYSEEKFANPLWTKFIKTDLIKKNDIRFESRYDSAQDSDFTIKCYRKTKNIAFGTFYTVNWIHPRNNSVSSTRKYGQFINLINYHNDYIKDINNWNLSEEEKETMIACYSRPMRHYTLEVFEMSRKEVLDIFDLIECYFKADFKKLPTKISPSLDLSAKIIYDLYDIIGIKNTARLLYFYLHKIKKK